jgi:hypothetical protein
MNFRTQYDRKLLLTDNKIIQDIKITNYILDDMILSNNTLYNLIQNVGETKVHRYEDILPLNRNQNVTMESPFVDMDYRKICYIQKSSNF